MVPVQPFVWLSSNRLPRLLSAAAVLVAMLVNAGVASAQAKKYATPQAVYDAAKVATAKKDYQALRGCYTAESVDSICGGMIFIGSRIKAFAEFDKSGKGPDHAKQVETVFEKHGLTKERFDKEKIDLALKIDFRKDAEAANKTLRVLGKLIKDQPGFFGDMSNLLEAQGRKKDSIFDAKSVLEEVVINGNTGKARVVRDKTEKAINFKKIDGGWRIDLSVEYRAK